MKKLLSWVLIQRLVLVVSIVAGSVAMVGYVRWAMRIDPFARFRQSDSGLNSQQVAVELRDVRLWNWEEGKLVLSCDLGRVDIRRDRQHLDFYDVTDGVYHGAKTALHFAGPKANYDAGRQFFQVSSGARVWNKDIDLKAEGLRYRQQLGKLTTDGAVTGRLFEGQVSAMNLIYFPETHDFDAGPIRWVGTLKGTPLQEVAGDSSVAWDIKGNAKARGEIWTYTSAEATDGDIIVKAPTLEWNRKTDVLTAIGKVEYYSKKANLICDKAVIYRKEKRSVLTGNVTMLVKPEDQEKLEVVEIQPFRPVVPDEVVASRPKPSGQSSEDQKRQDDELRNSKNARKYPISITSGRIEYWYKKGKRHAIITENPQARQDFPNGRWRHMWTNKAFYDAEKETLELVSSETKKDTRIKTSIGDVLVAKTFITSTKEDEDHFDGTEIEGTVISKDEELNNRSNPPPAGTKPPGSRLRGRIGGRV